MCSRLVFAQTFGKKVEVTLGSGERFVASVADLDFKEPRERVRFQRADADEGAALVYVDEIEAAEFL